MLLLGVVNNCFNVKFVRNSQVVLHQKKRIQLLMPFCPVVHPNYTVVLVREQKPLKRVIPILYQLLYVTNYFCRTLTMVLLQEIQKAALLYHGLLTAGSVLTAAYCPSKVWTSMWKRSCRLAYLLHLQSAAARQLTTWHCCQDTHKIGWSAWWC